MSGALARVGGASSLRNRDCRADERDHQRDCGAGQQRAQASGAADLLAVGPLALGSTRLDERALRLGDLRAAGQPVERVREPRPPVQLGRIAVARCPTRPRRR